MSVPGVFVQKADGVRKRLADGHLGLDVGARIMLGEQSYVEVVSGGLKIVATDLPRSDPQDAGQLWADSNGFLKISAGPSS